jgi:hypothetical protein
MKTRTSLRTRPVCLVLALLVEGAARASASDAAATLAAAADTAGWRPELLPREREIAAALAAAPASLREGAGVYLLGAQGFVLDRPSRNGFHCLVARDLPTAFEPQCFDAEGSETLLVATLLEAELRMAGRSAAEVKRAVGEAWTEGRLRAPRRPGINYMLSRENRVPVDDAGTVRPYGPHLMFYAPYLRNSDFGVAAPGKDPIFLINEGLPGAYVIVPVVLDEETENHAHP